MGLKEDLGKYTYWQKKNPGLIVDEVGQVGGWKAVFSDELPKWAHRVRNFFNQEPSQLNFYQFNINENSAYKRTIGNINKDFKRSLALSGVSYLDENKNTWLQMSPGAASYHFKHNLPMWQMSALLEAGGQSKTPIFKLVLLDRSKGGSRETIILNPFNKSEDAVGSVWGIPISGVSIPVGESVIKGGNVKNRIYTDSEYQGSYNYGDTIVVGSNEHTRFDVTPHEQDPKGYINPSDRFSNLFFRKFPTHDNEGNLLAELKW